MDIFEKNMNLMKENLPDLWKTLEGVDISSLELVRTRNGQQTIKFNGKYLHSRYDPTQEAERFIDSENIENDKTLVIFGCALGYHVTTLFNKTKKFNQIIIIEPDLAMFKAALKVCDFSSLIDNDRTRFFIGMDPQDIYNNITGNILKCMSAEMVFIEWRPSVSANKEYFELLSSKIKDAVRTCVANINTVKHCGKKMLQNSILNFPEFIKSAGFVNLRGKFEKIPAIIVSAGPSLDKNISQLHKAKGKILIAATDTAFKILYANNIRPDLIFTMDFKDESEKHFQNIPWNDIPLIFDLESSPKTLAAYNGPKFTSYGGRPLTIWMNSLHEDKGHLNKGMSVAHMVFHGLIAFGCEPIIFIGQDLSYPEGKTHAKGTDSRETIGEHKDYDKKDMLTLESEFTGETLETRNDMYVYLRHFEKLVQHANAECINATEGGAGIKGTKVMSLAEAIDVYAKEEIDFSSKLDLALQEVKEVNTNTLQTKYDEFYKGLEELEDSTSEIMSILESIFDEVKENGLNRELVGRELQKIKDPAEVIKKYEILLRIIHSELLKEIMQVQREGLLSADDFKNQEDDEFIAGLRDDYDFQRAVNEAVLFLKINFEKIEKKLFGDD